MKHKTLFRLLLKFLGVWIFVYAIADLPRVAVDLVLEFNSKYPSPLLNRWQMYASELLTRSIEIIAALYLFFGGKWLADKAIPSNRPYCHECGYELTGNESERCPECGTVATKKEIISN